MKIIWIFKNPNSNNKFDFLKSIKCKISKFFTKIRDTVGEKS